MDLAFVEKLLEAFGRSPATELELAEGGWRIRLSKTASSPTDPEPQVDAPGPEAFGMPGEGPAAAPEVPHAIVAGLVGTFYRRPAPDKPPFVEVGDLVEDGQTLGIMEAMKTLIGVDADRAGRVSAIFKEDNSSVEPGEALFAIVPADRP